MNTRPSEAGARPSSSSRASSAKDADIAEAAPRDLAEQPGDAVLEHLAADKADLGMPLGLFGEVLAAAEADLEPDRATGIREQRGGSSGPAPAGLSPAAAANPPADGAGRAAAAARAAGRKAGGRNASRNRSSAKAGHSGRGEERAREAAG